MEHGVEKQPGLLHTSVASQELESCAAGVWLPFVDPGLGAVTGTFAFARIVVDRDALRVFLDALPHAL